MDIVWIIFMALFIGYLAVPFAREVGYSYGRYGRLADLGIVLVGTVIIGGVVLLVLSALEVSTVGFIGAVLLGGAAAVLMVILLTVFSTGAASDEEQMTQQLNQDQ